MHQLEETRPDVSLCATYTAKLFYAGIRKIPESRTIKTEAIRQEHLQFNKWVTFVEKAKHIINLTAQFISLLQYILSVIRVIYNMA
jgi:hypothetical protein